MKIRYQNGFTLYELLITMLIVGVVLGLGLPNLTAFTQNSRVTTTANDLHSSLYLARSEAARAKTNITICGSLTPMAANAQCDGTFDDGWIIFVDSSAPAAVRDVVTENILKAFPPVDTALDIVTNGGATYFSFASTGLGRGNVNGIALSAARICDDRGNVVVVGANDSAARVLIITPIGRATVLRDKDQIDAQGGCP
jgi:type IV fimbrial biogenesis protein FimT